MTITAHGEKPYAGNLHVRFDYGEVAQAATPRCGFLLYKLGKIVVAATVLVGAELVAADVEWKWDESQHADTCPATVAVSVASVLPNTISKVNVGQFSTYVYRWLDSAGFGFHARKPGYVLRFR